MKRAHETTPRWVVLLWAAVIGASLLQVAEWCEREPGGATWHDGRRRAERHGLFYETSGSLYVGDGAIWLGNAATTNSSTNVTGGNLVLQAGSPSWNAAYVDLQDGTMDPSDGQCPALPTARAVKLHENLYEDAATTCVWETWGGHMTPPFRVRETHQP